MIKSALGSLVLLSALPACTPLGMIYAHRDTYGLDMTTGANSTAPFQINLGASNHMATYVPVGIPDGNLPVGSAMSDAARHLVAGVDADTRVKALKAMTSDARFSDMYSVYSTFNSKTDAGNQSVALNRGNMFATGNAARALAETDRARTCLELEKLADKNGGDATKYGAIRKTIDSVCPAK